MICRLTVCALSMVRIFFLLLSVVLSDAYSGTTTCTGGSPDTRPLSILLVVPPYAGHVTPFLAVGEELVRRGHNVTLVTAASDLVLKGVEKFKFNLWSISDEIISAKELTQRMEEASGKNTASNNLRMLVEVSVHFQRSVLTTIDNSAITSFDIMVGDGAFATFALCFSRKWRMPTIILWPSLSFHPLDIHAWPFPSLLTGYTDNLSFYQRVVTTISSQFSVFLIKYRFHGIFTFTEGICNEANTSFHQVLHSSDYLPQIFMTSFGFEFPRVLLPLTEYVGPIISLSQPKLPEYIEEWLDQKGTKSVVYVSMGSTAVITKDKAEAIINGATQANFSVVWSLRKDNQGILELMNFDTESVLIASWVPQVSILQHPSIHSAVMHGGLGGIQEALSCGIPIIVIPFVADQTDNAVRVQYYQYGDRILPEELTTPLVIQKLKLIGSELYRKSLAKIQRIYKKDGGASRTADLLEFYSEIGYEHLVPAYAKYNWNWVEFYNIDVYSLQLLAVIVVSYCVCRLICSCCSAILSNSKKKED